MQYKFQPDRIHLTAESIHDESIKGVLPKIKAHIFVEQGNTERWYALPEHQEIRIQSRCAEFTAGFRETVIRWIGSIKGLLSVNVTCQPETTGG